MHLTVHVYGADSRNCPFSVWQPLVGAPRVRVGIAIMINPSNSLPVALEFHSIVDVHALVKSAFTIVLSR